MGGEAKGQAQIGVAPFIGEEGDGTWPGSDRAVAPTAVTSGMRLRLPFLLGPSTWTGFRARGEGQGSRRWGPGGVECRPAARKARDFKSRPAAALSRAEQRRGGENKVGEGADGWVCAGRETERVTRLVWRWQAGAGLVEGLACLLTGSLARNKRKARMISARWEMIHSEDCKWEPE